MKDDNLTPEQAAELMEKVAERAAIAAHATIFAEVDKEEMSDKRKIGAALTAATTLYGALMHTAADYNDEAATALVRGLFELHVAPHLATMFGADAKGFEIPKTIN